MQTGEVVTTLLRNASLEPDIVQAVQFVEEPEQVVHSRSQMVQLVPASK